VPPRCPLARAPAPARRVPLDCVQGTGRGVSAGRPRAQGFVPYCHWTFPTQSVEDLHPSYMMAKRIVRGRRAGMGSTAAMLGNKITRNAPAVKVTQPLQPLPRALALDRRQEMSAEEIKEKSMVNKVVSLSLLLHNDTAVFCCDCGP
jgi:hypothetical protein